LNGKEKSTRPSGKYGLIDEYGKNDDSEEEYDGFS
jgi:hypothetical protein